MNESIFLGIAIILISVFVLITIFEIVKWVYKIDQCSKEFMQCINRYDMMWYNQWLKNEGKKGE